MADESIEARVVRLEERLRGIEEDMDVVRPRLHAVANAVNPVTILVSDVARHEEQLQELRTTFRAAKWLLMILGPMFALATAATPFIVRAAVRDVIEVNK